MAKIKFGMMMTDARGKLGGQVFSKNRSGAYVRTKVTPVNPRTDFQQANRQLLGTMSSEWSALSESQRSAWNGAVESWSKTDVFGDLQKPTGKNLFTGLNKNVQSNFSGRPIMDLPPAKMPFSYFKVLSITSVAGSGVMTIQFDSETAQGLRFEISATPSLSVGTSYVKNQLRSVGITEAVTESKVIGIGLPYRNRFGDFSVGANIYVQLRQVLNNGQLSAPLLLKVNVTA